MASTGTNSTPAPDTPTAPTRKPNLKHHEMAYNPRGGNCPTVYRDEAGNFYVQGKRTKPILKSELSVAEDEDLVMIPPSLIARIKQEL
jgi:hypothetical protein